MFAGAVKIALPAVASLLLINLTFGLVTRSAPQFNIFSIGFPVAMVSGFFIMMVTLPSVLNHVETMFTSVYQLILHFAVGGN